MQTRILNLPQALKLSMILGKYIQEFPKPESNVSDFLDSIFEKLTPEDFKECIELFTGNKLKSELDGDALLTVFFEGIRNNKIVTLLQTSKEIGFI